MTIYQIWKQALYDYIDKKITKDEFDRIVSPTLPLFANMKGEKKCAQDTEK